MTLTAFDWIIIASYFAISLAIGLIMTKRAGKSTGDFFLSGRKLPWYIAGTSMVATTFAADTPLAVTELVSKNGIAGNWLWWNMVFGGMLTVFFFARLWRRAEILTDAEFVSIRYSGKEAHFLRGFRAIYVGVFMNMIVISWINLAMAKIIKVMFPGITFFGIKEIEFLGMHFSSYLLIVGCIMLFTAFYSSLSGLAGVAITDSFQFFIAMTGCIILSVFAVHYIGGIDMMKLKLENTKWVFHFLPDINSASSQTGASGGILKMSLTAIITYLGVQWWASWYPGAEPGGGGYVAQRMMSAKNEKHSLFATLWFQIAHYAVRPWPWIISALVALILYPNVDDKGSTFVMLIRDLLPAGLTGLLLAAFLAAYMSSVSSQTVWGSSYMINDIYKPYINSGASEKHYVKISRFSTFFLLMLSLIVTTQFERISDAWKFVIMCSGGIGSVLILRWFWWRINAWSEISAMIAPYFVFIALKLYYGTPVTQLMNRFSFETLLLIIVGWSTLVWVLVTFITKPCEEDKLIQFYNKVHPGGAGWKKIAEKLPDTRGDKGFVNLFINWLCGCVMVLCALFGVGKIIFHEYKAGVLFLIVVIASGYVIYKNLAKTGWTDKSGN
jgi:solute:Na+ symporter, SSS family